MMLIKGSKPNKQKANLFFLRFDILSLSAIRSFKLHLLFNKNLFTNFVLLITCQSSLEHGLRGIELVRTLISKLQSWTKF